MCVRVCVIYVMCVYERSMCMCVCELCVCVRCLCVRCECVYVCEVMYSVCDVCVCVVCA